MFSRLAPLAAIILALALAGCGNQPAPGQHPTPARAAPPEAPAEDPGSAAEGDPAAGSGVIVQDESGATVEEVQSTAQRERDAEDCYAYASASVARDRQVKDDRAAIFDESATSRDVYAFTDRLDEYGNEQRRNQLFTDCMAAKGYAGGK